MESIVAWYNQSIGTWMPKEVFVLLVSMVPLVELRGGLVIAYLLKMPFWSSNLFCILGNVIPIPFILLFIRQIFKWMKEHNVLTRFVEWLERRAEKKSKGRERGEFVFLWLFVGIPIPGTGAWTGSLIASLMEFDIKKASVAIGIGILTAAVIMNILTHFGLGYLFGIG